MGQGADSNCQTAPQLPAKGTLIDLLQTGIWTTSLLCVHRVVEARSLHGLLALKRRARPTMSQPLVFKYKLKPWLFNLPSTMTLLACKIGVFGNREVRVISWLIAYLLQRGRLVFLRKSELAGK